MKTLEQKIAVMQAALDGKEIEYKENCNDGRPFDKDLLTENLTWNWQDFDYRIKPEPMEFWVNVYGDEIAATMVFDGKDKAESACKTTFCKTIKVREVTE